MNHEQAFTKLSILRNILLDNGFEYWTTKPIFTSIYREVEFVEVTMKFLGLDNPYYNSSDSE